MLEGEMRRRTLPWVALAFAVALPAAAAELNPATGALEFAPDALRVWHLDSPAELTAPGAAYVFTNAINPADATSLQSFFVKGDSVLEGSGAVHLAGGGTMNAEALLLADRELFGKLVGSRVEITAWVRAEGMLPALEVQYSQPDWVDQNPYTALGYAAARFQRTGRATSDGWIEVSTGPIDGSVLGAPIAFVSLFPSSYGLDIDYALVDAIEVRAVPGPPTPDTTCSLADRDQTCGPHGDCLFGQCVPESVVWGALPPADQRQLLGERWIQLASRLTGDRHSQTIGRTSFVTQVLGLENESESSRRFFEGLKTAVLSLRDSHTNLGDPPSARTYFQPTANEVTGSLDACFGIVDADLLGGGRSYAVFRTGDASPLKPGDVLQSIDGQAPDDWLEDGMARFGRYIPSDQRADPAALAMSMASMISVRAKTIRVLRCASGSACTGNNQLVIDVDVPSLVAPGLRMSGGVAHYSRYGCTPRVADALDLSTQTSDPNWGANSVYVNTDMNGETNIEFDGFLADETWFEKFQGAFASAPAKVLVDARIGNGGDLSAMLFLGDLLRSNSQPIELLTAPAASWLLPDTAQLFTPRCIVNSSSTGLLDLSCQGGDGAAFTTSTAMAPGANSRIAWVNTMDVSANDLIVRWLKGRSNVQIFGPVTSYGALGAIQSGETVLFGWSGGPTLQIEDSRVADTIDGLATARWESGHGIDPDVTVAETLSDLLAVKDTLLERARAWLEATP